MGINLQTRRSCQVDELRNRLCAQRLEPGHILLLSCSVAVGQLIEDLERIGFLLLLFVQASLDAFRFGARFGDFGRGDIGGLLEPIGLGARLQAEVFLEELNTLDPPHLELTRKTRIDPLKLGMRLTDKIGDHNGIGAGQFLVTRPAAQQHEHRLAVTDLELKLLGQPLIDAGGDVAHSAGLAMQLRRIGQVLGSVLERVRILGQRNHHIHQMGLEPVLRRRAEVRGLDQADHRYSLALVGRSERRRKVLERLGVAEHRNPAPAGAVDVFG